MKDTLGQRLRALRRQNHLYQKELADKLGVSRATIASWETDHRTPEHNQIQRIADFFGVSIDYLTGRTDIPEPPDKVRKERELDELLREETVLFEGVPLTTEEKESVLEFLKLAAKIAGKRNRRDSDK